MVADRGEHEPVPIHLERGGGTEEVRERIFEPFFGTRKEAGTGLGLSTVHRMVSSAGGTISQWPRPEGGTGFELHTGG